jgi:quercetin dioxygenase-like cupin family protein
MTTGVRPERAQPLWFIDNLVRIHIDGDAGGGTLALAEERGRRGNMPPLHVHHRDDEAFYVLGGELSLFVGGEHLRLGPGQAALAPRGVPHSYRVETDEARWLVITTPAGFESFVREVAEPARADALPPPGPPPDPAALGQAAARAGIEILGPPGTLPAPAGRSSTGVSSPTPADVRELEEADRDAETPGLPGVP